MDHDRDPELRNFLKYWFEDVLFQEKTGAVPSGTAFEIIIGILDARNMVAGITVDNADRLDSLPNNDQAYIIRPVDDKLILTGINGKGVYYAVMTLMQLIEHPCLCWTILRRFLR